MSQPEPRHTEHRITVRAAAADVYRLIAEVQNWPALFPPTVHAEVVERGGREERIRIWATANGQIKNWTSRRYLDQAALRIDFRQEVSSPPVAAMGGSWIIEPLTGSECAVRLLHDYRAVDDDPAGLDWIDQAVDRNSGSELSALKAGAELAANAADRSLTFEDSVRVRGGAKDLYDFVNEAQLWDERLPHVAAVRLTEDTPGIQTLRMDTQAVDGSVHTTESVRVCFPYDRIVYKQTTLPALLALHTGSWHFQDDGTGGATAVSRHTVVIETENISRVLGPDAGLTEARAFVRDALGTNSRTTLGHALSYAEKRR
ncbi:aromatase/cyclase [Streptomyces pimonensis]|uniref:Aromatase/cyclase n=1 Tax=Streptomyces pimonensis TaxID=2860288 RepID=A0ABV4J986_9ACTN